MAMGKLEVVALLVAIVFGSSSVSALYGPSSDVVQLTSTNFKNRVSF